MKPNIAQGVTIKQSTLDAAFLTGPGENLVLATLMQMASVPGFISLFGPYKPPTGVAKDEQQRWADYQRHDWSIRQLPAINIFESQTEDKTSDNAWLSGTVSFQIFWPPNFRRPDSRRIEVAFKGAMENFFSSKYVTAMLDELYYITRPEKVYGLNEYGKVLTWSPNTEGLIENEIVPVTLFDVRYRIDLRAWYRALEFMDRTKADPFEVTLADLVRIAGEYDGVLGQPENPNDIQVVVKDGINVSNP